MVDKDQKPSNPECYTPSSEPFRIYTDYNVKASATKWKVRFLKGKYPVCSMIILNKAVLEQRQILIILSAVLHVIVMMMLTEE
jgi:hypothetical protein